MFLCINIHNTNSTGVVTIGYSDDGDGTFPTDYDAVNNRIFALPGNGASGAQSGGELSIQSTMPFTVINLTHDYIFSDGTGLDNPFGVIIENVCFDTTPVCTIEAPTISPN